MALDRLRVEFRDELIDGLFVELDQSDLPGAAVGVALDGKVIYRKGFGLANMEAPHLLTPAMRLRIGSTSKHFACFAYMLLCEDGQAELHDTVGKFFPEFHPVTHNVTMRQLMGSIGGLRDVYDIFAQFNDHYCTASGPAQSVTNKQLLGMYSEISDFNAPPGTAWIYNNGGWLILTAVIERITGLPLEEVMRKRIFEPIGMNDSLMLRSDSSFLGNRAAQHTTNPEGGFEKMYWGQENFLGAGAVVSTVDDMLRWLGHMNDPRVGSPRTWEMMKEPQRLANGTPTGYGLGLMNDRYRGAERIHHPGNCLGGSAQMLKIPAAKLDVVVITNRQDVFSWDLANAVVDACVPALEPVKCVPTGPIIRGIFRSPETGRVLHLFGGESAGDKDKQFASFGGSSLLVRRDGDERLSIYHGDTDPKRFLVCEGGTDHPQSIGLSDYGTIDTLTRMPSSARPPLDRIVGEYYWRPGGTKATIRKAETGASMQTTSGLGSATFSLECLSNEIWRAKPVGNPRVKFLGGLLAFDADSGGFEFSDYQTRALPFKRCE